VDDLFVVGLGTMVQSFGRLLIEKFKDIATHLGDTFTY